jgi:ABC-type transport system substrate-binding protein
MLMRWSAALFLLALAGFSAGTAQVAPAPAVPAGEPEADASAVSTLRIPLIRGGINLDPHRSTGLDAESMRIISLVYDTLYMWVPGDQPHVVPALAADWPAVSDDGLTVTIKLRKDVKFHNHPCFGETRTPSVNAGDVVRSVKRAATYREDGMGWLMDTLVVGLDDFAAQKPPGRRKQPVPKDAEVEGLTAPDDETVIFKLTRPCASLPTMLAHPGFSIMSVEAIEGKAGEPMHRAVGTGPYRLNAFAQRQLVVLKRFDGHWGEAPHYQRLVFCTDDWAHCVEKFSRGIYAESPLFAGFSYEQAVENGKLDASLEKLGAELVEPVNHGYRWLSFNMADPVWGALDDDGRKLRRAVALACDRRDMLAAQGADLAWYSPQPTLLPEGTLYADTADQAEYGKFDRDAARKLLGQCKYTGGKDPVTGKALVMDVLATDDDETNATVGMLRKALGDLGMQLTVRYVDPRNYRAQAIKSQQHVFSAGWYLDYPDPANFLQTFRGINISKERELEFTNYARYNSEPFNKLFDEYETLAPTTANQKRLRELTAAMAAEIAKDQPTIPLERYRTAYLRSGKIEWPKCARQTFNDLRFVREKAE